jgi:hypothetical protein
VHNFHCPPPKGPIRAHRRRSGSAPGENVRSTVPQAARGYDVQTPRRPKFHPCWHCNDALGHFLAGKVPDRRHGVLHIVSRSWLVVPVEVSPPVVADPDTAVPLSPHVLLVQRYLPAFRLNICSRLHSARRI